VRCSPVRLFMLLGILTCGFRVEPAQAQFGGVAGPGLPYPVVGAGRGLGGYGWGGYSPYLGLGQNPYEGYLNGAANMTTANAQYQLTIQQARLAQEDARRSALDTRRKTIEERQYELSLMPDPEQLRQQDLQRALLRSRNNPPPTEIWSGKALNDLLRAIKDASSHGVQGPAISLAPDVLQHINFTTGTTYGNTGLLKNGGRLQWPYVLRKGLFQKERTQINEQVQMAVRQAQSGEVSVDLLDNIGASLSNLEGAVDAQVANLTPTEYIQSMRYVRELKDAYKILQQSDVQKYFRPDWGAQGSTVAELVRQMTQQGLTFAPAVSGDESYYTSLHRSLVDYDIGVAQLVASQPTLSGPPK
jgi:hypothetical protein